MNQPKTTSALASKIIDQIQAAPHQRISFAEFMDLALYHPQHGYYATNDAHIGPQGDFITSSHLGQDFGELLAEQFADMWHILGCPTPFHLVEMGAGQGLVAADVLSYLQRQYPDCFTALTYTIVEKSATLQTSQQERLASWQEKLQWQPLDEIATNSITGCLFSNELVDAFPVHLIEVRDGKLWEVFVGEGGAVDSPTPLLPHSPTPPHSNPSIFRETLGEPSTPRLLGYFDLVGIDLLSGQYPEVYRTEVNLAALDWMDAIATRLHQGFLLTIDYGYPAHRYYNPRRNQGTLQCYSQHRHHNDPYWAVGQQDITAHVDFTALERQGERAGLQTVGFTQQAMFLMALGIGERMAALSHEQVAGTQGLQTLLQRRDMLRRLIDPMGLGNFGVLLQSKGLRSSETQIPRGFDHPPMSVS